MTQHVIGQKDVPHVLSDDGSQRVCILIDRGNCGSERTTAGLYWLAPGEEGSPDLHPVSDEIYYVAQGRGRLRLDDVDHEVRQGQAVFVPAGTRHVSKNTGDEPLCYFFAYLPRPPEMKDEIPPGFSLVGPLEE